MVSSSPKSTSAGTCLPFISRKPRMRVILPSQFQPFKFSDDDLVEYDSDFEAHLDDDVADNQNAGDDHMGNDDDDDFDDQAFDDQLTDVDEEEIAMEEIVPDDENDCDNPTIILDDDTSEKEESTASNDAIVPLMKCKPRMRVMPPSRFETFGFTVTEADDQVDEADFDDGDDDDDRSDTMDVDEDFQDDYIILSDDDDDYDGVDDDGYLSDSSLRSTATQLHKSPL
ncbi:protein PFC0760c [Morus notabilis]|uniref:protein PFC0760c n=1 Tax=Morus notabilis TaxID=981085 RepID=UPI000CED21A2|nr:protein PFC0760c [Morus notabilis]